MREGILFYLCVQMREDALVIHGSPVFRFGTLDVLLMPWGLQSRWYPDTPVERIERIAEVRDRIVDLIRVGGN